LRSYVRRGTVVFTLIHPDAIERQLAHREENDVRAAYNYAEHLPERRKMMQAWADYLDALRAEPKAIRLKAVG